MKKSQIFLLVAVAIVALAYFFIPAVNKQITDSVVMLSKFDLNEVYAYLQSAAPTIAELHDSTAPQTQPNIIAFESVMRNAGTGSMML